MERVLNFEADGFPHDAGANYPGRELAAHLATGLATFATIISGPLERDHGWDTYCQYEGRRVWVLLTEVPPGWALVIGWGGDWAAKLRQLFTFGRRRQQMREWFESFCSRVEQLLRSDPLLRGIRRES